MPPPDFQLFRRSDANRDQRSIGRRPHGTTGRASFAQELRLISGRPAIGRHQDFIVLALHRAARHAVRFDDPDARARRTRLALRPSRAGRSGGTRRARRTGVAFRALRTRRAWIALRTLAATGQQTGHGQQQRHRNCQMRCTHFQILPSSHKESRSFTPEKAAPLPRK